MKNVLLATASAAVLAVAASCSLLDKTPYDTAQPGPIARTAATTATAAPAVASTASAIGTAAAPFNPAIGGGAALVSTLTDSYGRELNARLDAVDQRVNQLIAEGRTPTKGQVEYEKLLAMAGSMAGAFGFGRYHAKAATK